ncbi:MAG TPA: PAS domain-containing protein, partial [Thermopolyspora sp.]
MLNGWRDPRVPLTAAGFGAAGIALALILGGGAPSVVAAIAGVVAGLPAGVSLIVAAGRIGPGRRREAAAWRWLALGAITWLLGVGLRPVAEGTSFVLTFADLLLGVGTMLLGIGCGMSAAWPVRGRTLSRQVADGYLSAASLFVIGWATVLGGVYRQADEPGIFYSALALPALCLLVTCVVAALGARPPRLVGRVGIAVLCAITVAEFATAMARVEGRAAPLVMGLIAPVAFLFLAVVAWSAGGRPGPSARKIPHCLTAVMPLTLVAVATVVVVVRIVAGGLVADSTVLPVVVGSIVLVLLVRLFAMVIEGVALRRRLEIGESQLRRLAENVGDVVLVCDQEGVIQEIGGSVEDTYGYPPDQLVQTVITEHVHPEDVPIVEAALRA